MQNADRARIRGGDFDDGLRRLNGNHWLIDFDLIAFFDVPTDDLGLGKSFAQIRKIESCHAPSVQAG